MSRVLVFTILLAVSALTGGVAWQTDPAFSASLASQIFWMTLGALLVTIVLEALLEAGGRRRRREADRFALRTLTASLMIALEEVAELKDPLEGRLLGAAVQDQKRFAQIVRTAADAIKRSDSFSFEAYLAYSGKIAEGLRSLSWNYIRLLAESEAEMVQRYRALNRLADRWRYVDEFTEASLAYAERERSRLASAEADLAERKRELAEKADTASVVTADRPWLEESRRQIGRQEQEVARERARLEKAEANLALRQQAALGACQETAHALADAAEFMARTRGAPEVG